MLLLWGCLEKKKKINKWQGNPRFHWDCYSFCQLFIALGLYFNVLLDDQKEGTVIVITENLSRMTPEPGQSCGVWKSKGTGGPAWSEGRGDGAGQPQGLGVEGLTSAGPGFLKHSEFWGTSTFWAVREVKQQHCWRSRLGCVQSPWIPDQYLSKSELHSEPTAQNDWKLLSAGQIKRRFPGKLGVMQ